MKMYLLPEPVLAALISYLETRPYKEVAGGMGALSNLREAVKDPDPDQRQSVGNADALTAVPA